VGPVISRGGGVGNRDQKKRECGNRFRRMLGLPR
jgi:hypothetical protein